MKNRLQLALALCAFGFMMSSLGINYPPYEVFGYLADDTDNPPVNYMKVCDPGRTGEENASYIVLGISFPKTYTAVAANYDGDLVIPAYIDGLPVRKINEAAFIECNKLRSVHLPTTIREIGSRAFVDCLQLTNVTFESGVSALGDFAFSNCVSLASVRFPKTLSQLGYGCFHGCVGLRDVYFEGNAPRLPLHQTSKSMLGESIYRQWGYYERFKVHINDNTYGWIAPYVKGVPEKWPIDSGFMQAHETVAEHVTSTIVRETGFVTIITEVSGSAVAIPDSWPNQFPSYKAKFGNDFTASLLKPTGKKDAMGNTMLVWQDYVAGTDPTDQSDRFVATISIQDGTPTITTLPALSSEEKSKRKFSLFGRTSLMSGDWIEISESDAKSYNFFKVRVEMR